MKRPDIGRIRPSQLVTTFGPGAIVDLRHDSAIVTAIDYWPEGREIQERFLQERLEVASFQTPKCEGGGLDVPVVPFPDKHVCPSCRRIVDLSRMPAKIRAKRGPMCTSPKCRNVRTYPARLITVCPKGHIDDFPWSWWVHKGKDCSASDDPILTLTSSGSAATLSDLRVRCQSCGAHRSLSGALGKDGLRGWKCSGRRPWVPDEPNEDCTLLGGEDGPRGSLRGATNLYFSSVVSQLSIPPFSDPIEKALDAHWKTLSVLEDNPEIYRQVARSVLQAKYSFDADEIDTAIEQRLSGFKAPTNYRHEEYNALRTPPKGMLQGDFRTRPGDIPDGFHLGNLVLVEKLREVRALAGFSRIDAPDPDRPEIATLKPWVEKTSWVPGTELFGEGLFLQVDEERLGAWEKNQHVLDRVGMLLARDEKRREERGWTVVKRRPGFVMLHTLAHVLINVLSLECGYSSASLKERVYAEPGQNGILIYTGTVDSDGSLGGLLRQGAPDRLPGLLQRAIDHATLCSGDPLCRERAPEKLKDTLNGVACHACVLVSETSCEHRNHLLDRATLVDLPGVDMPGFFSDSF
ncbi:MAG: DrmB family protein [Bradymonadia bacterium]